LVGASAYIEEDYTDLFLPDKLWQTIPKPDTNMKWLSYFLSSEHARYTLSKLATGTSGSMKNITKGELLGLKVEIPPFDEQCKIAKILATWNKAISTTECLIANSKQQKKSLMQQLLTGKKRLFDDSGKPFEGEWEQLEFGECISHVGGTPLEKYVKDEAKHHFISIGNYSTEGKYIDKGQRVELNDKTMSRLLNKNDLVMVLNDKTKSGDIIGSTILIDEDDKYIYNQRSERITPHESINVLFIWFLLNSFHIRTEVFSRSQGGTQIYVNFGALKTIHLNLPKIEEQLKIAAVLTNANKETELLKQQLTDLKQEKKALMQQLLTGKRRVKIN
jgi:type I restriction enzyme S subunit